MGSNCTRVTPIVQLIDLKPPILKELDHSTKKPSTESHQHQQISTSERPNSPAAQQTIQTIDENRRFITTIIQSQRNTDNGVEHRKNCAKIEVADPEAFNVKFVKQREQAIDNSFYRSAIKLWRPSSLYQLITLIQSLSRNKSLIDCHWIIFYWITYNIKYDAVSYFSKTYTDQSAQEVFRTKTAVCVGFANIYKYLCDKLNLRCEKVCGCSKGYGFEHRKDIPTDTHHVWNAVQINNHWYLIESTWGAGYLTEEEQFQRKLNPYYFFAQPNEMIYHHLPEDDQWQLLRFPVKMNQYLEMPRLEPVYFQLKLQLVTPRNQNHVDLLPQKSFAAVVVRAPPNVFLTADLKQDDQRVEGGHRVIFDRRKQLYCFYFSPRNTGQHKVTIYGKQGDTDEGTYTSALSLDLNIRNVPKRGITYPKTWQRFYDFNTQVISPKDTHVITVYDGKTNAEILIRTSHDVELLGELVNNREEKIQGGHEVFFDRRKELWRCRFAPNVDGMFNANILAKKKADCGPYMSMISFKLDAKRVPTPPHSYPRTWQLFYDLNLKIESPLNGCNTIWFEDIPFTEIRMSAADDVFLSCNIEHNDMKEENATLTQYDHKKQQWQLLFAPQCTGPHNLLIFGHHLSNPETAYSSTVQFNMNVTKLRKRMKFPLTYADFITKKCHIYQPLKGTLKRDTLVQFHCYIPRAIEICIEMDSKWVRTKGYNDPVFKTEFRVGSKDVIIFAKYNHSRYFSALVKYNVE